MLPWQRHKRQPSYQNSVVGVVNLRVAIFGDQRIKGFGENKTLATKLCSVTLKPIF